MGGDLRQKIGCDKIMRNVSQVMPNFPATF